MKILSLFLLALCSTFFIGCEIPAPQKDTRIYARNADFSSWDNKKVEYISITDDGRTVTIFFFDSEPLILTSHKHSMKVGPRPY